MPRTSNTPGDTALIERLMRRGEVEIPMEEKLKLLQSHRQESRDNGMQLDRFLLAHLEASQVGLADAQSHQKELSRLLKKFGWLPWHPAVFLHEVSCPEGTRAMVMHRGARSVVEVADVVDLAALRQGDDVFLGRDFNIVMSTAPYGAQRCGETALFQSKTTDGRLLVKCRDEEVVVEATSALQDAHLEPGDFLRWDRGLLMAFEKIPRQEGRQFLLEEVPDIGLEQVGGQAACLKKLLDALSAPLAEPDKAARYGLGLQRAVLLVGPPGCGKTLVTKVALAELQRRTGRRCRFAVVRPGEFESPWVGEAQRNIRDCFSALRKAAGEGGAVLFLDEVEAVGRIRGNSVGHHSDRFLAALLAELDGFSGRHGVAVVVATNRKDLLDPALLERLSDVEIQVDRPNQQAARAIFEIHLPGTLPFYSHGATAEAVRGEMIQVALSRLYSPNGESELCTLRFRDGKARTVSARELVSGRLIRQISTAARQAAFVRDASGAEAGLRLSDMHEAVSDTMERLRTTVTRHNAHAYLSDLPQDVDIVSVEPISRRIKRPYRFLAVDDPVLTPEASRLTSKAKEAAGV